MSLRAELRTVYTKKGIKALGPPGIIKDQLYQRLLKIVEMAETEGLNWRMVDIIMSISETDPIDVIGISLMKDIESR